MCPAVSDELFFSRAGKSQDDLAAELGGDEGGKQAAPREVPTINLLSASGWGGRGQAAAIDGGGVHDSCQCVLHVHDVAKSSTRVTGGTLGGQGLETSGGGGSRRRKEVRSTERMFLLPLRLSAILVLVRVLNRPLRTT